MTSILAAVNAGSQILKKLQVEHPKLKAYLVLTHEAKQVDLTTNPTEILANCDPMVVASPAKQKAMGLLAEKKRLEAAGGNKAALDQIAKDLEVHAKGFQFVRAAQVEVRFATLKYELVWALQKHPLVDQELTPQTRAAIRIVLGNIGNLSQQRS